MFQWLQIICQKCFLFSSLDIVPSISSFLIKTFLSTSSTSFYIVFLFFSYPLPIMLRMNILGGQRMYQGLSKNDYKTTKYNSQKSLATIVCIFFAIIPLPLVFSSNLMILISWISLFSKMSATKTSSINVNKHQDQFELNQLKPSALLLLLKNFESLAV